MTKVTNSQPRVVQQNYPQTTQAPQQIDPAEVQKLLEQADAAKGKTAQANTDRVTGQDYSGLGNGVGVREKLTSTLQGIEAQIAQLQSKGSLTPAEQLQLQQLIQLKGEITERLAKPAAPVAVRIEKLEGQLTAIDNQIGALKAKDPLTEKEQGQLKYLQQKRTEVSKKLDTLKEKVGADGPAVTRVIEKLQVEQRTVKAQLDTAKATLTQSSQDKAVVQQLQTKYDQVTQKLEQTITERLTTVEKQMQEIVGRKDLSSSDTAELRKLVKERSSLNKKLSKLNSDLVVPVETAAQQTAIQGAATYGVGGGTAAPGSEMGGGAYGVGGGSAAPGSEMGGGVAAGDMGGAVAGAGVGGPISTAGGDIDSMIGPYAATLDKMTTDIETLMGKGDLNEKDSRQLQWLMMKRSELSMLISQVLNVAHETRKHIIGNIR